MHVTMNGVIALEKLRAQLEEDAGRRYPHDVRTELLMLNDICRALDMSIFYTREVMGDTGWSYVQAELDTRIGQPTAKALKAR